MAEHRENKVIPFYAMQLRDAVRPVAQLRVNCWTCQRVDCLDLPALIHRFGPNLSLRELERKTIRCKACGGTANSLKVEWIG